MPLLTFDEATELAFFGATVLHPSAMQPAMQVPSLDVRVKNSYNRCLPASYNISELLVTNILKAAWSVYLNLYPKWVGLQCQ